MTNETIKHLLNPLIDENPIDTLANIQAMLARIQTFAIDGVSANSREGKACPATDLYGRLLIIIGDAINYEINRLDIQQDP
ncbi:MAG: hypothetical protein AAFZ92_04370 [Pseudomonadota bacterium]